MQRECGGGEEEEEEGDAEKGHKARSLDAPELCPDPDFRYGPIPSFTYRGEEGRVAAFSEEQVPDASVSLYLS